MVALIIWLALAVVLGAAELMTVTLTLGLIAVAAVAAAVTGAVGLPVPVQILAFVLVSGAGLGLVRPIAMRHIKQPPPLRTGTAALVGRTADRARRSHRAQRPDPHRRRGMVLACLRRDRW